MAVTPAYIQQKVDSVQNARFGIETRVPVHDVAEYLAERVDGREPEWEAYKTQKTGEVNGFISGINTDIQRFNQGIDANVQQFSSGLDADVQQFNRELDIEVSAFITTVRSELTSDDEPYMTRFIVYA